MKINTKYYKTWEEYRAAHPEIGDTEAEAMASKMQSYEDQAFLFVMNLCI